MTGASLFLPLVMACLQAPPPPEVREASPAVAVPVAWPGQGDPAVEAARRRILARESRGNYAVVDRSRRWFGAYQMSRATSDHAARRMDRLDLLGRPAHEWSPEDQDAAFYVLYDRGRGARHWHHGTRKGKQVRTARRGAKAPAPRPRAPRPTR